MFFLLALPLCDSQVNGRLLGGDGELVDVLPPLGLEVFVFLLFSFLLFLELHLLNRQGKTTNYEKPVLLLNWHVLVIMIFQFYYVL